MNVKQKRGRMLAAETVVCLKRNWIGLLVLTGFQIAALLYLGYNYCGWFASYEAEALLTNPKLADVTGMMAANQITAYSYIVFALFFAMKNFSYLFSKRKLDFYHALPVPRATMLLSRFFAGGLILLSSGLAQGLLAGCIRPIIEGVNGATYQLGTILGYLGVLFLVGAAALAVCTLCAVCSGTRLLYLVSCTGILLVFPVGATVLCSFVESGIAGLRVERYLLGYVFPARAVLDTAIQEGSVWLRALGMALVAAVCLGLSFQAYRRGKSEQAEQGSYAPAGYLGALLGIQVFCLGLPGSVAAWLSSTRLTFFRTLRESPWITVGIGLALCAAAVLVFELVRYLHTRQKQYGKAALSFGAVLVCGAALGFGMSGGGFGYVDTVPELSDIQQISYQEQETSNAYFRWRMAYGQEGWYSSEEVDLTLDEAETFRLVREMHRQAVKNEQDKSLWTLPRMFTVTYHLKDGGEVRRTFPLYFYENNGTLFQDKQYMEFLSCPEYAVKSSGLFEMNSQLIAGAGFSGEGILDLSRDQVAALLEAVKQDMRNQSVDDAAGSGTFLGMSFVFYSPELTPEQQDKVTQEEIDRSLSALSYRWGQDEVWYLDYVDVTVNTGYANTIALLEQHGLIDRAGTLEEVRESGDVRVFAMPMRMEIDYDYYGMQGMDGETGADFLRTARMDVSRDSYTLIPEEGAELLERLVQPGADQGELYARSPDGYAVFFAAPDGGERYLCSPLYFVPGDAVPELEEVMGRYLF
ncbi:MAG: ABC transporter permease [Clostridiales bacterium]|nr:ABC transporter permease [Clostridiales bacterium]